MLDKRAEVLKDVGFTGFDQVKEPIVKTSSELNLFVSFDIYNSTSLKYSNEDWFSTIEKLIGEKFFGTGFWKFNGDEIIFRFNVGNISSILEIIEECYKRLPQLKTELSTKDYITYVKATIWLARTDNSKDDFYNKHFKIGDETEEFVGINIDEGFRLTKHCAAQKIALDSKIVFLLLETLDIIDHHENEYTDSFSKSVINGVNLHSKTINDLNRVLSNIHYIGCTKCKGIWNNQPYPVFWYYQDSDSEMLYNEYFEGKHIWNEKFPKIDFAQFRKKLLHIFKLVNEYEEIKRIKNLLFLDGEFNKSFDNKPNLYYMVVCRNPITNKFMIAKRSNKRVHLKNVWDLGNVKYQNTEVTDTIKQEYLNTFGINIIIETDDNRDNDIIPFGYCTIYRNCKPQNCLLFYATIYNPNGLSDEELISQIKNCIDNNDNNRYSDVKFVSSNDLDKLSLKPLTLDEIREDSELGDVENSLLGNNRCIMHLHQTLKAAENYFQQS